MSIVDETLPDDDSLVSDLSSYIRETRVAVNTAGLKTNSTVEVNVSSPDISVEGKIDCIMLSAPYAQDVDTIEAGDDGDLVIIHTEDSYVTLIHSTGNIFLRGDPAAPDFPMQQHDCIAFIYVHGVWAELYRTLI